MSLPFSNQSELNLIVGKNLEALRKRTPFNKTEFLQVIGLGTNQKYPETYYNKIMRGEVGLNVFTLLIIQRTFTITIEELCTP